MDASWRDYFLQVRRWARASWSDSGVLRDDTSVALESLGVLQGVSQEDALLLRWFVQDISQFLWWQQVSRPPPDTNSDAHVRILASKIRMLFNAFREVRRYSGEIAERDPALAEDLYEAFDDFYGRLDSIEAALNALHYPGPLSDADRLNDADWGIPPRPPRPDLSRRAIQVTLHGFFVESGCSSPEAQIRVADIGNSMFGWEIAVRRKSDNVERSRGADAVRKAVKRALVS